MIETRELTRRCADHLAGRSVNVLWQNPPCESAAGQVVKTPGGGLVVYIADLTGVESRFKVYLHELAHIRADYANLPVSDDHTRPAGSIRRSQAARAAWKVHPMEDRARQLAAIWLDYANRNAYKYWRVGRSEWDCKLLALLDWEA